MPCLFPPLSPQHSRHRAAYLNWSVSPPWWKKREKEGGSETGCIEWYVKILICCPCCKIPHRFPLPYVTTTLLPLLSTFTWVEISGKYQVVHIHTLTQYNPDFVSSRFKKVMLYFSSGALRKSWTVGVTTRQVFFNTHVREGATTSC